MQCGAKCFVVEMIVNGKKLTKKVTARSSILARKTVRTTFGRDPLILTVKPVNK